MTESVPLPAGAISPRQALGTALLCAVVFAGAFWLVKTGAAQSFDRAGLVLWRGASGAPLGPEWLREGVRDFTSLGGVLLRNLFVLATTIALLLLGRARQAAILVGAALSAWAVDGLVKHAVLRPRPLIVPHLTEAGGFSFPSGHSLNAAAIYLTAAAILSSLTSRATIRALIFAAAIGTVLAVGCSRVWLGVHWPTDVIAGWAIGGGCASLWITVPGSQRASTVAMPALAPPLPTD